MKTFVALFVAGLALAVSALVWSYFDFIQTAPSASTTEVIYEVTPGTSFKRVASDLALKGLVTSAFKFTLMARLRGDQGRMRVGEYALRANMTPDQVLTALVSGKSIDHPFGVAEGLNMYDVAALFESRGFGKRDEFLKLCRDPNLIFALLGEKLPTLEGYLFPETYNVTKYTGAEGLVRMMVQRFVTVFSSVDGTDQTPMSRHQLMILASIIEKETGVPEERPLISSVFHNRMKLKMRLQTDPTVLYGILDQTGQMPGNITRKDLITPTRYNTYVLPSLPFGPIANPGRAAIEAALRPAASPYLYFVSRNDGTHIFSSTYKDHNSAVKRFQLDPKARAGKSWRDLNQPVHTKAVPAAGQ